jgi:heparosan-N-sulfate-glucuronate 5-epimerase
VDAGARTSPLRRLLRRESGDPGFFNSARAFGAPIGTQLGTPERPRGYYIDFSEKATSPTWPPPWLAPPAEQLHVTTVQWALGAFERFLRGDGEQWLRAARDAAEHLLAMQESDGPTDGAWLHRFPMPHTFRLDPPWVSGITQGEGASLLIRLHLETGDGRYAEGARRALAPMRVPSPAGGVLVDVGGLPLFEEYPTDPPSLVLNGEIFALWGLFDAARTGVDPDAEKRFDRGLAGLVSIVDRYDTGHWSLYDLYPHPVPNVAGPFYHLLHIHQLTVLNRLAPHPAIESVRDRFRSYLDSRLHRARALSEKVAFRLLVPRNRALADRLPWGRRRGAG